MSNPEQSKNPRLVLILGGARSGKSTFAEQLGRKSGRSVAFIATATESDEDMKARIALHRASRPVSWTTIEEPLDLAEAIQQAAQVADVLLLDCMTLWLANWIGQQRELDFEHDASASTRLNESALRAVDRLLAAFASLGEDKTLVIVSNEVGLGIVPLYAVSRAYRDVLGRVNQRLAQHADRVYLMIAGLGVDIKRLHEEAAL